MLNKEKESDRENPLFERVPEPEKPKYVHRIPKNYILHELGTDTSVIKDFRGDINATFENLATKYLKPKRERVMYSENTIDSRAYENADTIRIFEQPGIDALSPREVYVESEGYGKNSINHEQRLALEAFETTIIEPLDPFTDYFEANGKTYDRPKNDIYNDEIKTQSKKVARQKRIDVIMERSNERVKNRGFKGKLRQFRSLFTRSK